MTTEAAQKKPKKAARKPRPRPTNALAFTVWAENGSPLPPAVVQQFEDAIQRVQFELFNDGTRILTQTTKG